MRRLMVFNSVTLDGYFAGPDGDLSWAHKDDPEWNAFVAGNAGGGGELLFGRVTYELMASYWPTPMAMQNSSEVARGMNQMPKVVFSRTLHAVPWQNTRLVKGDMVSEVRKMKQGTGDGMVILGSGSIVSQLAQAGLIDEFQLVVNPIVLGQGKPLFQGLTKPLPLRRTAVRSFANGNVLLTCQAA